MTSLILYWFSVLLAVLGATEKARWAEEYHIISIATVDASPFGLGAILSQMEEDGLERPISYVSRSLNSAEKQYSQIQKEATAIIYGITYINLERPAFTYVNPKYGADTKVTCRRVERSNPVHYCNLNLRSFVTLGNNFSVDIYFYQFLTNTYKRSFVELHYRFCDLINKDNIFGSLVRMRLNATTTCPYPPGFYNFNNMTIQPTEIPRGFPFTKGRVYVNVTFVPRNEQVCSGYCDMELKEINAKKKNIFDFVLKIFKQQSLRSP